MLISNISVSANYHIILPDKKRALYLQLRDGCFGNVRFATTSLNETLELSKKSAQFTAVTG